MLGLLSYLPTVMFVPHYIFLLIPLYLFYRHRNDILYSKTNYREIFYDKNFILIVIIIVLSFFNLLTRFEMNNSLLSIFPYTSLILITYLTAKCIRKFDIKVLIILIFIESVIALIEYLLKINTVFYFIDTFTHYADTDLIYFTKSYGLSENSSGLAYKLLIGFILIDYTDVIKKYKWLYLTFFFIGVICSFSRTVISVLIIYFVLRLVNYTFRSVIIIRGNTNVNKLIPIVFLVIFILGISFFMIETENEMKNQFSKGNEKIELSGREVIWPEFQEFICDNFLFGNNSNKYYVDYLEKKASAHAHNSYLQVLANNGIVIFIFFILLIVLNINEKNYLYLIPLVAYSFMQYGLFWGISLIDIVFFYIITNTVSKRKLISELASIY